MKNLMTLQSTKTVCMLSCLILLMALPFMLHSQNVGINTTSPQTALHVADDNNVTGGVTIGTGTASDGGNLRLLSNTNHWNLDNESGALRFFSETGFGTGGIERFRINADGQLGIGIVSPNSDFQAEFTGTRTWGGGIFARGNTAGVALGQLDGFAQIGGQNASATAWSDLILNSGGGNVGIGNRNFGDPPLTKLHVNGDIHMEAPNSGVFHTFSWRSPLIFRLASRVPSNGAIAAFHMEINPQIGTTLFNTVNLSQDVQVGGQLQGGVPLVNPANFSRHITITGTSPAVVYNRTGVLNGSWTQGVTTGGALSVFHHNTQQARFQSFASASNFNMIAPNGAEEIRLIASNGNGQIQCDELSASVKLFNIDHPLEPSTKYLRHTSIESDEMTNIYSGTVQLDAQGQAIVELPKWMEALNDNFRYQLTPIGAAAPNLFIAERVNGNRFKIAGGSSGLEVSWQVTGIRQDAWAKKNRTKVEVEKQGAERGKYLHPELFDQPVEKGIKHIKQEDRTER